MACVGRSLTWRICNALPIGNSGILSEGLRAHGRELLWGWGEESDGGEGWNGSL